MRALNESAFPPHTRQERRGGSLSVPGTASDASQVGATRSYGGVTSSRVEGLGLERDPLVRASGCGSFFDCAAALIGFAAAFLLATGHLSLWLLQLVEAWR